MLLINTDTQRRWQPVVLHSLMTEVFPDSLLFHVESCSERSLEMGRVCISPYRQLVLIHPLQPLKSMLLPHGILKASIAQ